MMLIPHGAYILTIDGGHMQLLRNSGRGLAPRLERLVKRTMRNPPNHILSSSPPGRRFESAGIARSAYSLVDEHQKREDAFGIEALDTCAEHAVGEAPVIVIAPPRMLGVLRRKIPAALRRHLIAELDKDLADFSPRQIADYLRRRR